MTPPGHPLFGEILIEEVKRYSFVAAMFCRSSAGKPYLHLPHICEYQGHLRIINPSPTLDWAFKIIYPSPAHHWEHFRIKYPSSALHWEHLRNMQGLSVLYCENISTTIVGSTPRAFKNIHRSSASYRKQTFWKHVLVQEMIVGQYIQISRDQYVMYLV